MKKWMKQLGWFLLLLFLLLNVMAALQVHTAMHFYDVSTNSESNYFSFLTGKRNFKSKVVDSLSVPHTAVWLTTKDGLHLSAWYAANKQSKGTVILFHGHGSNKSAVISEATYFYSLGYHVLMVDFRAHGESEGTLCTIGYKEVNDVKAAYDFVTQQNNKPVILWGISLGAATILKTLHDFPSVQPEKIILEMPFGSLYEAVQGTMRNNTQPQQPASFLFCFWGSIEQGFWAFNMKPCEYASYVKCPALLQWGKKDVRVTSHEINCIYNHLPKPKSMVVYEQSAHESLCKKEPAKWKQQITSFLNASSISRSFSTLNK